ARSAGGAGGGGSGRARAAVAGRIGLVVVERARAAGVVQVGAAVAVVVLEVRAGGQHAKRLEGRVARQIDVDLAGSEAELDPAGTRRGRHEDRPEHAQRQYKLQLPSHPTCTRASRLACAPAPPEPLTASDKLLVR